MNLLDKYILREWSKAFFLAIIATLFILILEDIYDDMGDFLSYGATSADVIRYYVVRIPSFIPIILPVSLLLSLLFSLGTLHRNHEIMAMRAAGLSLSRITRMLWISGIALSGFAFYLSGQLVPKSIENSRTIWNTMKFRHQAEQGQAESVGLIHVLAFENQKENRLWFMNRFSEYTYEGYGVTVFERSEAGLETRRILAREAHFDDYNGHWVMNEGRLVTFDAAGEPVRSLPFEQMGFEDLTESPTLMTTMRKKPENLSVWQMREVLKSVSIEDNPNVHRYAVAYARVWSSPFICLICVAIAIPFSASGVRANPLVGVSKALGLFFLYYVIANIFGLMGAGNTLNPWVAALLPNFIMLGVAGYFFVKNR